MDSSDPNHPPGSTPPPSPPPDSPAGGKGNDEQLWAMLCHLSAMLFFATGVGHVVGPLIVWLIKKDEFPQVDRHGKASLNFQISMTIYVTVATLVTGVLFFFCPPIPLMLVAGLVLVDVVCVIIASIKASEGVLFEYPLTIRFLK